MALKVLKEEHYKAIELLLHPKQQRMTKEQIAKEVGVHRNTLTKWERDELFQAELKKAVVTRTHSRLDELVSAMMDNAIETGNAALAKLLLQMNGMLVDKHEIETKDSSVIDYGKLDEEIEAFSEKLLEE
jgi:transcriptional regulator with XRE-family HTH domain